MACLAGYASEESECLTFYRRHTMWLALLKRQISALYYAQWISRRAENDSAYYLIPMSPATPAKSQGVDPKLLSDRATKSRRAGI